eukprot:550973_1
MEYGNIRNQNTIGEWKTHVWQDKAIPEETNTRKVSKMKHLKELLVAYYILQDTQQQYIQPKQAYSILNMKTSSALNAYLSFAYCMERKNMEQKENGLRLTFDDKQLDLGIWTYMKQNMGYEKADELKKDKKNIIPLGYKPDLRLLGIPVLFVSAPNISKETDDHRMLNTNENHNNDTQSAMDVEEYKNENTTNTHVTRPPPLLEPTSHPLVDQTNRYGLHGQANRYHNTQQHGSQRGRYYRGYHGHMNRHRNQQRARTRSRSSR